MRGAPRGEQNRRAPSPAGEPGQLESARMNSPSLFRRVSVAVGSTRRPKIEAVREALAALRQALGLSTEFAVEGAEVSSGVRPTPLSRGEMMAGARRRAEELAHLAREQDRPWEYFIGLEGGIEVVDEGGAQWVFLENWAYAMDRAGRRAFGQSGAILLPDDLARRVLEEGADLADAMDVFSGLQGIRDAQGAWGVLTRNVITRQDAVRISVINAFAPILSASVPPVSE